MKKLLIGTVAVLVLALAGLAAFLATFDINRYKADIIDLVKQQTGRDFDIAGPLKLEISLQPAIAAQGVRVGNAAWDAGHDMISVQGLKARTALLPLLHGQLQIKSLEINGARILLERDAKGIGNWVFTGGTTGRAGKAAVGSNSALPVPDLQQISIDDAVIRYLPGKSGKGQAFAVKHLKIAAQGASSPVSVDLSAVYNKLPIDMKGTLAPLSTFRANRPYAIKLDGRLGKATLALEGSVGKPASFEDIKAKVSISADSLASLGGIAGQALPALRPVSLAATIAPVKGGYKLQEVKATLGHSELAGDAELHLGGARPRIIARIQSPMLDLAEMLPASDGHKSKRVFSTDPLNLEALSLIDGQMDFDICRLRTASIELVDVKGKGVLKNGALVLDPLHAGIAGGKLDGRIALSPAARKNGKVILLDTRVRIKGLLPGKLPKFADKHLVDGAPTDIDATIKGSGTSLAGIMGTANGKFVAKIGAGKLNSKAANIAGTDILNMLQMLNPLASHQSETHLRCAVTNFDIRNGTAATHTGIAMQTDQLNVVGGGTIDLKTEAIDIAAKPQPRQGVGVNLAGLSDFVHLGGTLSDPKPVADAAGIAKTGAKVGLAFATGGLSLLAQGLFDRATADDDVCAIALGTKPLPKSTQNSAANKDQSVIDKTTTATKNAAEGVGNAVKGVFQGLFGK